MRSRIFKGLLMASALLATSLGGQVFAQGPELAKSAIGHGLSMAISGCELHALGSRLQAPEAKKLVEKAQKDIQASTKLLTAAYQEVKSEPGSSPTQKFYGAVTEYTKILMQHVESPGQAQASEVAMIEQVNCAVKSLYEAHKLEQKIKGENSPVAAALKSHAEEMRSGAKTTLEEVRRQAKQGTTVMELLTQADAISQAIEKL